MNVSALHSSLLHTHTSFECNGSWQAGSIVQADTPSSTPSTITLTFQVVGGSAQITRVDFQAQGTPGPYSPTTTTPSTKMSRYSQGLHTVLPLIPESPTALITITDPEHPVIVLTLPAALDDVWGVEVRASDNSTVLVHFDLTDPNYLQIPQQPSTYVPNYSQPFYTLDNSVALSRSLQYYAYTYNLLGEYSAPTPVSYTIPSPSLGVVTIDDTHQTLNFTPGGNAKGVHIVYQVGATVVASAEITLTTSQLGTAQTWSIPDEFFFRRLSWLCTPYDSVGTGSTVGFVHQYTPTGVVEFDANEVVVLPVLQGATTGTPASVPTLPAAVTKYGPQVTSAIYATYFKNNTQP